MSFHQKLQMYARLLVKRGMNVQPGQFVQVHFDSGAVEELALLVVEEAYQAGARHVEPIYGHPRVAKARLGTAPENRFFFPAHQRAQSDFGVDVQGCYVSIRSDPAPNLFDDIPALKSELDMKSRELRSRFYDEGVNKGQVSWCVTCPPSQATAETVYPNLSADHALTLYWDAVFRMTMADKEDCLERWARLNDILHQRCATLNELKIDWLDFTGPGTELRVGLSEKARWIGGSKQTAAGKLFTPNVPSFEVFTTPDWRQTDGTVRVTRPVKMANVLVGGITMRFEGGDLVEFDATSNRNALAEVLARDDGAKRLGEVALVGVDSPVFQEGRVFQNTLYDENAACHVALGRAYTMALQGGWILSKEELEALGCNDSLAHEDVMISDEQVDVVAVTRDGREVQLLENGAWVI